MIFKTALAGMMLFGCIETGPNARGAADTAHDAFTAVTDLRGWSDEQQEANWPFLNAVIAQESDYCFNVRGGDSYGDDCVVTRSGHRSGHYSDSGYGQVNWVNHAGLCRDTGICGPEDITSSPEKSMTALVWLFERSGTQPWCYTARLRRQERCQIATVDVDHPG